MTSDIQADPSQIGRALPAPFLKLPEPETMFALRAHRFDELAQGHGLEGYLRLMAGFARAQHRLATAWATAPARPGPERQADSNPGSLPLPRRSQADRPGTVEAVRLFLAELDGETIPEPALGPIRKARSWSAEDLSAAVSDVLADSLPLDGPAAHALVACALQVHFAGLATALDPQQVSRGQTGLCPVCGAPPVSSLVAGWPGAENSRYCSCSLCGTLWNAVRVTCIACGSTAGIGYREIDGGAGVIKAECCDACHTYMKVFYTVRAPDLEPVADDVTSLALDLLLREEPFHRASFNPLMLGV